MGGARTKLIQSLVFLSAQRMRTERDSLKETIEELHCVQAQEGQLASGGSLIFLLLLLRPLPPLTFTPPCTPSLPRPPPTRRQWQQRLPGGRNHHTRDQVGGHCICLLDSGGTASEGQESGVTGQGDGGGVHFQSSKP